MTTVTFRADSEDEAAISEIRDHLTRLVRRVDPDLHSISRSTALRYAIRHVHALTKTKAGRLVLTKTGRELLEAGDLGDG